MRLIVNSICIYVLNNSCLSTGSFSSISSFTSLSTSLANCLGDLCLCMLPNVLACHWRSFYFCVSLLSGLQLDQTVFCASTLRCTVIQSMLIVDFSAPTIRCPCGDVELVSRYACTGNVLMHDTCLFHASINSYLINSASSIEFLTIFVSNRISRKIDVVT